MSPNILDPHLNILDPSYKVACLIQSFDEVYEEKETIAEVNHEK